MNILFLICSFLSPLNNTIMDTLKVGDLAPVFSAKNQNDETINLDSFKGKKVILYFYPKDNTPGCTAQACNLKDNYSELTKQGFIVIGVSTDNVKSHHNFATKFSLPFHLIADEDKSISTAYHVYGEKKFMGRKYMGITRTTFLINEKGVINHIIEKPNTKKHTEEILEILN